MRTNLKNLRTKKRLTQSEIAEKLNISVANYNLIENGKRRGSYDFWKSLKETFNLKDNEMWKLQEKN